jgi:hypothetical protein
LKGEGCSAHALRRYRHLEMNRNQSTRGHAFRNGRAYKKLMPAMSFDHVRALVAEDWEEM